MPECFLNSIQVECGILSVVPPRGIQMKALTYLFYGGARGWRKRSRELQQRIIQDVAQSQVNQRTRCIKQEEYPNLGLGQPGQSRLISIHQCSPTAWSAFGVDRYPSTTQGVQVPINGSFRYFELLCQLASSQAAFGL